MITGCQTSYSRTEFSKRISAYLAGKGIAVSKRFLHITDTIVKYEYKSRKLLTKGDVEFVQRYVDGLLANSDVTADVLWKQILENYKSTIALYTINDNSNDEKRIAIRDGQMAKNLAFIIGQHPDKKFIVWLANGHMIKTGDEHLKGQTMGYQFRQLMPETSYHIAFGSIKMPPEKNDSAIMKEANDSDNILSYLPSVKQNYFLNADKVVTDFPQYSNKAFSGVRMFNIHKKKQHY